MTEYSIAEFIKITSGFESHQTDERAQVLRALKSLVIASGDTMDSEIARVGRLLFEPFIANEVPYSIDYGHETRTLSVSAMLFDKYDFCVRTEADGDADADVVVFSIRYEGELIRMDYDSLETFGDHFTAFVDNLRNKLNSNAVLSYAVPYRDNTYASAYA